MTTIRDSNTAFITILDPLPQENIGWWLEFYDWQTQSLLARVYSYLDFSFSVPLSDVGACEINMSDYDPLWTSILPNTQVGTYILEGGPHFVDFIDEGVRRSRCILDFHSLGRVRENGERPRQITGKGLATVLDWGVVLPVSIGASTSGNRTFTGVHWAGVWRFLFLESQARGAIPSWVSTSFDTSFDSYGVAWGDVGDYEIPEGQSLLDLLQQFQEQHGFEWRMSSSGILSAAPTLGDDRSSTVRFFEHESVITADDSSDRKDLRTHVYVLGGDNLVTLASDTAAATTWGRREKWVSQSSATDSNARTAIANTLLGLAKAPLNSRTFKVPFDPRDPDTGASTHRRAFVDYETGFIVGYGPNTDPSTNFRVVEMAVKVDPDTTDLEITVMSRRQREIDRLSKLLARILSGQTGISGVGGGSSSIVSSKVIAAAIRLGDLLDVNVGAAVAKDMIVYDGSTWNAGRPALDDLSDVDVSTATDGQVLTRSGGIWVGAAAGAVAGPQDLRWSIPSGETSVDEFNNRSIDPAWVYATYSGYSPLPTYIEGGDVLSVKYGVTSGVGGSAGDGGTGRQAAIIRPLSGIGGTMANGDAFYTAFTTHVRSAQYRMSGLILSTSGSSAAGRQLYARWWNNVVASGALGTRDLTNWGGDSIVGTDQTLFVGLIYVRIVRVSSTTWRTDYSIDGVSWILNQTLATWAFEPTHVGFAESNWNTATPSVTGYEFLRRQSGVA